MSQNVRLLGGDLLHLGKVGFYRCQRVTVKIVVDAVPQILRAEIDLVVFAGIFAVQMVRAADPVIEALGVSSLSRSHSMPHRMSTLPLYSALQLGDGGAGTARCGWGSCSIRGRALCSCGR